MTRMNELTRFPLDKLVAARISHSMEEREGFDRDQHGFRRGKDTVGAIEEVTYKIRHNRRNGTHSLVVCLDLKNAFGTAWGPAIVKNMREKNINEELIRIVKSFMEERKIGVEGEEWDTDVGCPQGSSLGPILWLMVMEGWFKKMERMRRAGGHAQAYADDQIIILSGRSAKAIEKEWKEVWRDCKEWAKENKLGYNVAKTEAMFIPARREIREPVLMMDQSRMELRSGVKYLGVKLDKKLIWLDHVKSARARVHDVGNKFFALGKRKWGSSRQVMRTIYERVVCPIALYGATKYKI